MNLEQLKKDCIKKQKKGIHFILASIVIWTMVLMVQLTSFPILTKNLLTFCCTAPLLPISFLISKILKIQFQDKSNPLNNLGILFSANQMIYLLIAMWVYPTLPDKMLMVIAMIFGAHLLPYGWLYNSKSYMALSIIIPILSLIVGLNFASYILAMMMIVIEIIFSVLLLFENKKIGNNSIVICKGELSMKYYHMTSLDRLNSISKSGLMPRNEDNSKLINDKKNKVFFSEGFEGAIALFVDFEIVYENIKCGKMKPTNKEIEEKVLKSKNLSDFLGQGVYLQFDGTNIENERNFENGCTSKVVPPENLYVSILKSKKHDSIIFSRFEIIKYMMSKITPEEIKYYGVKYKDSPNFIDATIRIQEKVKKYYISHSKEIQKYRNNDYWLEYLSITDFVKEYLKSNTNYNL